MTKIFFDSDEFLKLTDKVKKIEKKVKQIAITSRIPLDERWLDTEEACTFLHVSKRTLQTYRDEGRLPFSRNRNKLYFRVKDLEKFRERKYGKVAGF